MLLLLNGEMKRRDRQGALQEPLLADTPRKEAADCALYVFGCDTTATGAWPKAREVKALGECDLNSASS